VAVPNNQSLTLQFQITFVPIVNVCRKYGVSNKLYLDEANKEATLTAWTV